MRLFSSRERERERGRERERERGLFVRMTIEFVRKRATLLQKKNRSGKPMRLGFHERYDKREKVLIRSNNEALRKAWHSKTKRIIANDFRRQDERAKDPREVEEPSREEEQKRNKILDIPHQMQRWSTEPPPRSTIQRLVRVPDVCSSFLPLSYGPTCVVLAP